MKSPEIKIGAIKEDPSYTDPEEINKARCELLALDTEGKIFIAPNQPYKGELEMWQQQLFESRKELDGKSAYDFFDRIILGHGEGPSDVGQRTFKGADKLSEEYQGTINDIKERIGTKDQKVLTVVCGTAQEDKATLTSAIQDYLSGQMR